VLRFLVTACVRVSLLLRLASTSLTASFAPAWLAAVMDSGGISPDEQGKPSDAAARENEQVVVILVGLVGSGKVNADFYLNPATILETTLFYQKSNFTNQLTFISSQTAVNFRGSFGASLSSVPKMLSR
jgi:hypothetical protein